MMPLVKVWLREPQQSDDEAIKLMVDEITDISDVLLKVPELLRVQHLKPSEIQAEYKDVVLSNRLAISTAFEGASEGTLVIRPRPGVVIPNTALKESSSSPSLSAAAAASSSAGARARSSSSNNSTMKNTSSRVLPKGHPPPSPRPKHLGRSPCATPEPLRRSGSLQRGKDRLPIAQTSNKGIGLPQRAWGSASKEERPRSSSLHMEKATSSRQTTPRRNASVLRVAPPTPPTRPRHLRHNAVQSRYLQEAEKVRAVSKKAHAGPVCDSFKPQWGKPLCLSCNHTKQAHWAAHKNRDSLMEDDFSSLYTGAENGMKQLPTPRANGGSSEGVENGDRTTDIHNGNGVLLSHTEGS